MRPERLELEGFATYREPTVIDFTGADLFALTGATGAGKSTIVDAVCFALYGNVPRLADKRAVAPVISQGRLEAKVRLDFAVEGRHYAAVRVVRATKTGASTREARLERLDDGEVLAGSEAELEAEVSRLLGLSYEHFTTCVVLPQGDFASFLHAKPSARQDLLVELLDLGLYGQMRELARLRQGAAESRQASIAAELDRYATATPERRALVHTRLGELDAALALVDRTQPELDALTERSRVADETLARVRRDLGGLDAIAPPEGLDALATRVRGRRQALEAARRAEGEAATAAHRADAALAALPARAALEAAAADHDELSRVRARVDTGVAAVADLTAAVTEAESAVEVARAACDASATALEAAQRADLAGALVAGLSQGDPCPVCGQTVHELAHHTGGEGLEAARRAKRQADDRLAAAERDLAEHANRRAKAVGLLDSLREQAEVLSARLADAPAPGEIGSLLERVAAAEAAVGAARQAAGACRDDLASAERELASATEHERAARETLTRARDTVASLDPPVPTGDDLRDDWDALVEWTAKVRPGLTAEADGAERELASCVRQQQVLVDEVGAACAALGVEPGPKPGRVLSEERSAARAELESIDEAIERAGALRAEDAEQAVAHDVAAALATHLKADRFERWVLDEALRRLVASATGILFELSQGQYSLTLDGRSNFGVVDHASADAVRSARTLSGGETFLASLALALALADEVARLASGGAARLESIFLDEGFGTLDGDTLDTVAAALEDLQAAGRMVGVISHVPELALRMPVRFEVTKGPSGSRVERVDA